MTEMEIFLSVCVPLLIIAYYVSSKMYKKEINEQHLQISIEQNKLYQLAQSGAMNSLLNVKKFNDWFNSDKDPSIYAHPGIFLRTDKLSKHHFDDYIKMSTYGYLTYDDFDFKKMLEFEERVRKDWVKRLHY